MARDSLFGGEFRAGFMEKLCKCLRMMRISCSYSLSMGQMVIIAMLDLDSIDHRILDVLRRDGRISMLDLADRVGLSPTPCGRRVKRMEEAGVITGYAAQIDRALGLNVCVLVSVRLARHGPGSTREFLSAVARHPEITECLLVTGNLDYAAHLGARY